MNRSVLLPLVLFLSIVLFESLITSCASISSPSGGPQDTTAPRLDTSFPANFSTRFRSSKVELIFNEYISLKSPQQQISISPPLNKKPNIISRGKTVTISWEDSLLANTTYIISFGNAIQDFTEGNINSNFKYVFSTGEYIDSLDLSGYVYNKEGKGIKDITVALYDYATVQRSDSIPFHQLPTYYAYTDDKGKFELSNLKYSTFHVVAFQDLRQNFKLNSGAEKIGFLDDSLKTSLDNEPITIHLFDPAPPQRFYGGRYDSYGKLRFAYSYSPSHIYIRTIEGDKPEGLLKSNPSGDTLTYWFKPDGRDSLKLITYSDSTVLDTIMISIREMDIPELRISSTYSEIRNNDPVTLKSNLPLSKVDSSKFHLFSGKDTIAIQKLELDSSLQQINIVPGRHLETFVLSISEGGITSMYGTTHDTLQFNYKTLKKDDLGNLDFMVRTQDSTNQFILRIYNGAKKIISESTFKGETKVRLKNQKAGIYNAVLIVDSNGDGKWTTGDYLQKRQAEKIIYYKEEIEVRANWDLELEWRVKDY